MIKEKKSKVVEFNCRFGDPETQPLLFRLQSDALDLFYKTAKGELDSYDLSWKNKSSVTVVLSANGYPMKPEKGKSIQGLNDFKQKDVFVFHAGTKNVDGVVKISGGRVLGVTADGETLNEAIISVYNAIEQIDTSNLFYRKDIGQKGL